MRASGVIFRALVDILAGMIVNGESVTGDLAATALVTAIEISAAPLTRTPTVVRQALVNVYKKKINHTKIIKNKIK